MIDHILETLHIERIDDLPLLLAQLQRMQVIQRMQDRREFVVEHCSAAGG